MNKHIEVVKRWLADKDSVSKEELEANYAAADAAADAAAADDAADAARGAADDAHAAANASYYAYAHAAKYSEYAADKAAADWVGIYEALIDGQRKSNER